MPETKKIRDEIYENGKITGRQDIIEILFDKLSDFVKSNNSEIIIANIDNLEEILEMIEDLQEQEREYLWEENKRMHREIEVMRRERHNIQEEIIDLSRELESIKKQIEIENEYRF